jgi:hypothetical protein
MARGVEILVFTDNAGKTYRIERKRGQPAGEEAQS